MQARWCGLGGEQAKEVGWLAGRRGLGGLHLPQCLPLFLPLRMSLPCVMRMKALGER